jgi:hypothetical protein
MEMSLGLIADVWDFCTLQCFLSVCPRACVPAVYSESCKFQRRIPLKGKKGLEESHRKSVCGEQAAHLLGSQGWTPMPNSQSADPGWMVPLIVMCSVYITFVSTAGESEMYVKQRPLPLMELYDVKGGRAVGLISLLKDALWQVGLLPFFRFPFLQGL